MTLTEWVNKMADTFKPEDVIAAKDALHQWMQKFPEASKELQELWTKWYNLCGHKQLARELVKK